MHTAYTLKSACRRGGAGLLLQIALMKSMKWPSGSPLRALSLASASGRSSSQSSSSTSGGGEASFKDHAPTLAPKPPRLWLRSPRDGSRDAAETLTTHTEAVDRLVAAARQEGALRGAHSGRHSKHRTREGHHVWALGRHVALEPLERVGLTTFSACTPSLLPELLVGARFASSS